MIGAVVTTHNEVDTIAELIEDLHEIVDRVWIIDEASSDGTVRLAQEAGAYVMRWQGGIGPCLMRGWRYALGRKCETVVQLDAGGSHDPYEAKLLLDEILRGADMVVGSRFMVGAGYSGRRWRAHTSRAYTGAWNLCTVSSLTDWTSGYRAFTADALRRLLRHDYFASMHAWQAEVLRNALRDKLTIAEVPIAYAAGRSSLKPRHAWEAARLLVR